MTREEAIAVLKGYIENPLVNDTKAFDMAIQALSQEPCDDAVSRKDAEQMFRNIRSHLKPQDYKSAEEFNTRDLMLLNAEQMIHALPSVTPKSIVCDDVISREAVKKWVCKTCPDDAECQRDCDVIKGIDALPPVTPHQKHGKWIVHPEIETSAPEYLMFYECSECGDKQCFCKPDIHKKRFCSNCGARMVEPQESEG